MTVSSNDVSKVLGALGGFIATVSLGWAGWTSVTVVEHTATIASQQARIVELHEHIKDVKQMLQMLLEERGLKYNPDNSPDNHAPSAPGQARGR